MEQRYTDLLHVTHPILFRANYGWNGGRGAPECNNGWLEVIDKTCNTLEYLLNLTGIPESVWPYAQQIKEKFGLMRFYTSGFQGTLESIGTDGDREKLYNIFYGIIAEQENATVHICERCGSPEGQRRGRGWIHVMCDSCEQWNTAAKKDSKLMESGYYLDIPYGDTLISELKKHIEQVE
jgi:hypothetical protein